MFYCCISVILLYFTLNNGSLKVKLWNVEKHISSCLSVSQEGVEPAEVWMYFRCLGWETWPHSRLFTALHIHLILQRWSFWLCGSFNVKKGFSGSHGPENINPSCSLATWARLEWMNRPTVGEERWWLGVYTTIHRAPGGGQRQLLCGCIT